MTEEDPIEFPAPSINQGKSGVMPVKSQESYQHCPGVLSSSGMAYELGQVVKNTIYGHILVGVILEPYNADLYARSETIVAVKKICADKLNELGTTFEDPIKEISALQIMGYHENIIRILECIHDGSDYFTVMEFCTAGSLSDLLAMHKKFTESQSRIFFRHILAGLSHMKAFGICHRDLSLHNIVMSQDEVCKIIDFGMALRVPYKNTPEGVKFFHMPPQGACGKESFIAPEVIQNTEPLDGFMVDIWALGIILFSLLVGRPPITCAIPSDPLFPYIRDGHLSYLINTVWKLDLSPHTVHFLQKLIQTDPSQRLTLEEIIDDPWVGIN